MGWHLKDTVVNDGHFYKYDALENSRLQIEVEDDQSQIMTLQEYMESYRCTTTSEGRASSTSKGSLRIYLYSGHHSPEITCEHRII